MSETCRQCSKTPKMACSDFSAKRATKRQSPIDVSSSALPKLPVSSSLVAVVPHTIIRSPRPQPGKFVLVIQKDFCNTICQVRTHASQQGTYMSCNDFTRSRRRRGRAPLGTLAEKQTALPCPGRRRFWHRSPQSNPTAPPTFTLPTNPQPANVFTTTP